MSAVPIFAGLSFAGLLMLAILGLVGLKVLSVVLNAMFGRRVAYGVPTGRVRRSSPFPWIMLGLLMMGVLVLVRVKAQRSAIAAEHDAKSSVAMMKELHRDQATAQEIVREVSSRLPKELFDAATEAGLKAERDAQGNIEVQAGPIQVRINGETEDEQSTVIVSDPASESDVTVVSKPPGDRSESIPQVASAAQDEVASVAQEASVGPSDPAPQDPPVEPAAPLPAAPQAPGETVTAASGETTSSSPATVEGSQSAETAASEPAAPAEPAETASSQDAVPAADVQEKPGEVQTPNGPGQVVEINFQNLSTDPVVRQQQLKELAERFADSISNRLQGTKAAGESGSGISESQGVLVFEIAQASLEAVTGQEASEFLRSLNEKLPKQIQHTYALVPVEAGGSVTPVAPIFATGALTQVADAIYHVIEQTNSAAAKSPVGSDVEIQVEPVWVRKPAEGQLVAETEPIIDSTKEAEDNAINNAVNDAICRHILESDSFVTTYGHRAASSVELQLDPESVRHCIKEQYTRHEVIPSETGEKPSFRKIYMLLSVPKNVTEAAETAARQDVQQTRIGALAVITGMVWLSITMLSGGFRLFRSPSGLRRLVAVPMFLASLPLAAGAIGLGVAAARDEVPRAPWRNQTSVVPITVSDVKDVVARAR
ncbi:MAG: hypothetical protein JNM43_12735 [Planctomycetaceae bacterium]|nr:hypothetical protein [Planctomycetaceae bacterium]